MRDWTAPVGGRVVLVSFDPGEDFLDGLRTALGRHGVRSGVMLSTVATFDHCALHQVQGRSDVSDQRILRLDGPVEVTGVSGIIASGRPHLHATVADTQGHAYGGHLEPDCPVLYLAEAAVLEVDAASMDRALAPDGVERLHA